MPRGTLLGLTVESAFPLVAVPEGSGAGRPVRLERVTRERLDGLWPSSGARRTNEQRFPSGRLAVGVDHHPEAGYRIRTPRHGHYVISLDGHDVVCAAPDVADWRWQRMLLSQALPVAATAQGLELLHASGVTLGDGAIGIAGNSGSGKSSLGAHLVLRGAGFLTDDVLALEEGDGVLMAHPGAAAISLRASEADARLGRRIGTARKSLYEVERDGRVLPLRALYFPAPADGEPRIDPFAPTFPDLVRHNFNWNVSTSKRLEQLLHTASAISASVASYSVTVPPGADWAAIADLVERHAESLDT